MLPSRSINRSVLLYVLITTIASILIPNMRIYIHGMSDGTSLASIVIDMVLFKNDFSSQAMITIHAFIDGFRSEHQHFTSLHRIEKLGFRDS